MIRGQQIPEELGRYALLAVALPLPAYETAGAAGIFP